MTSAFDIIAMTLLSFALHGEIEANAQTIDDGTVGFVNRVE